MMGDLCHLVGTQTKLSRSRRENEFAKWTNMEVTSLEAIVQEAFGG